MKLSRLFGIAALAATSLVAVDESKAAPGTLPDLLSSVVADSPFVIGDKTVTFLLVSPTGNQAPNPANVTVSAAATPPPFGITLTGVIVSATNTTGTAGTSDLAVQYSVTSSGPPITAVLLGATGSFTGGGFGSITEIVHSGSSIFGPVVGQSTLTGNGVVSIPLSGAFSTVTIEKDIFATAPTIGSVANYSIINQGWVQGVPEPASMVMMGTGLLGVVGLGWTRARKQMKTA